MIGGSNSIGELLESGLSAWRLSHMLLYERGPLQVFTHVRGLVGIEHNEQGEVISWKENELSYVFTCMLCISIWAGALISCCASGTSVLGVVRKAFAISAVAILVDGIRERYVV